MKKAPLIALAGFAALAGTIFATHAAGIRLNTTASLPLGVYRVLPLGSRAPSPGDIVVFCLPDNTPASTQAVQRGYLPSGKQWGASACPHGLSPLMKPVAAVGGDRIVDVPRTGLSVNGAPLPNSLRLDMDPAGRPLAAPATAYVVPTGHIVVVSPLPNSFDSRYFGPVPVSALQGAAVPLFTR